MSTKRAVLLDRAVHSVYAGLWNRHGHKDESVGKSFEKEEKCAIMDSGIKGSVLGFGENGGGYLG